MSKRIPAFCVLILCTALTLAAQGDEPDRSIQRPLNIIMSGRFYTFDPQESSNSTEAQLFTGLYEGLFSCNPLTLEPEYALAQSYKVSGNKKKWTFTIRGNAAFSDGTPITAETIRASWLTLLSPEKDAPFASLLDCIKGARAYRLGDAGPDDVGITANGNTLVVRLDTPCGHLPKILCHASFAAVSKPGVYSGPFVMESFDGATLTLAPNTFYWDKDVVCLPQINFILSEDTEANIFALNTGAADWIAGNANTKHLYDPGFLQLSPAFATEYYFFMLNQDCTRDVAVRQALMLATPWEELRSQSYYPAETFIPTLRNYPDIEGVTDTDFEEAREILKEAGYEDGDIHLSISVSDVEYFVKHALLLQESFRKIGVELEIKKVPSYEYYDNVKKRDADIYSYSWIGDFLDPMAFLELFRGNSTLNETLWQSEEFDQKLDEAAAITDRSIRYKKLAEAEQILLDSGMVFPIEHSIEVNFVNLNEIGGWYTTSLDLHPLKYLYIKAATTTLPNVVLAR